MLPYLQLGSQRGLQQRKACADSLYFYRVAEDLAWAVGAPTDLPSRGAVAFLHTLQLTAEKAGHTHLPWEVLLQQTQRALSSTGTGRHCQLKSSSANWPSTDQLHKTMQAPRASIPRGNRPPTATLVCLEPQFPKLSMPYLGSRSLRTTRGRCSPKDGMSSRVY